MGLGPETFGILVNQKTANNPYNQLCESAYNEYHHILITVGLAGLISYLVFIFENVRRCLYCKDSHHILWHYMYSIQAIVNINFLLSHLYSGF